MQNLSHIVFGNYILTVSLFAWTVAQVSKTAIHAFLCGKFQAERLWGAGGMPSSHSALVCALAVSAAKSEGMASSTSRRGTKQGSFFGAAGAGAASQR